MIRPSKLPTQRREDPKIITTADVNALFQEEKIKDLMGCNDISCATEIGGALDTAFVLTGTAGSLGRRFVLGLNLVDVKMQQVLARSLAEVDDREDLYGDAIAAAVSRLVRFAQGRKELVSLPEIAGPRRPTVDPRRDLGLEQKSTCTAATVASLAEERCKKKDAYCCLVGAFDVLGWSPPNYDRAADLFRTGCTLGYTAACHNLEVVSWGLNDALLIRPRAGY